MQKLIRSRISDAGRVVIPAELRRACQLEQGQEVFFCQTEQGIELLTLPSALERAQSEIRRFIPGDQVDLTEELLTARTSDDSLA